MPLERFYFEGNLTGSITLQDPEHHHLRVIRTAVGETVELVNGKGFLALAKVVKIEKKETILTIIKTEHSPKPIRRIVLAVPLMRPNKLEWVIEKGTELGADAFYLYPADFSEKTLLTNHQLERLRNLSIAALKQSGRLYLPEMEILASLEKSVQGGDLFFGDTRPDAPKLINSAAISKHIIFVTGPEKGFSKDELHLLEKMGHGVALNPYTLRAETAPIAALAILGSI